MPCQVWTTGFFDKSIVGQANAWTGGLGNLGGGVTYFVMPAVYNSLRHRGETKHKAWRVSFIVPGILIVFVATCILTLCQDTPTGKWSERQAAAENSLVQHDVVTVQGNLTDAPASVEKEQDNGSDSDKAHGWKDHEAQVTNQDMLDTARGEIVQKPTFKGAMKVIFTLQTLTTAACYFCTFGAELSINSILGAYYTKNFKHLTLQESGNWAAMFGLLNGVARPLGGYVSDWVYRGTHTVWGKKAVLHTYGIITGIFLIIIGKLDSHNEHTMFGLIAGLAFFLEGANGADFGLVPHVHPHANGIVSGVTGACGNLGGIIFAIIFRYNGKNYGKVFWIIGTITICMNLAVSWIKPIPKGQIGGR